MYDPETNAQVRYLLVTLPMALDAGDDDLFNIANDVSAFLWDDDRLNGSPTVNTLDTGERVTLDNDGAHVDVRN